jgi:hypothetical protein
MKLFDHLEIKWNKNNKIKIKYCVNNEEHYYIPDFIVLLNEEEYIIEMKGFDWDNQTLLKKEVALEIYKNYRLFYDIEELKFFLQNEY